MGKPWYDHLVNPGSQKEAKKASGKLYRWMLKEGIVDAIVKIWCALPDFSSAEKEKSYYQRLCHNCATVLWFATLVQLDKPQLASNAELLKPIFHYLLEEPNIFSGVRAMSLSLLLHLWFLSEPAKRPEAADVRKAIAQHKDAWKLLTLLKDSVDNPSKGLEGVEPHTIVQASYACLLRLLINTPTAPPLPTPFLETACRLLGTIPDALV
ncbi:hypothetical protein KFL_001990130 [Klebsormidium nitens]|uniref:Uncharacterized protein n=1 Tax=Klebsormidium nitens TaxID=105231 RepID=A0A1Y1I172_KLENI|nr:hypothetical protein KFL_001990130 [Klebsormidium nitens]|eukprot:GAQ84660.1 hypothetical protein KFL_001990130 [Klebsormidium nitens]